MTRIVHPRLASRRAARVASWWGRAWERSVEEAAYDTRDLRAGRALARSGAVGAIAVEAGRFAAAVPLTRDPAETVTVEGTVPVLPVDARSLLVELVGAEAGRIGALMAGDLPIDLVEQADDGGAELLPSGGEIGAGCGCDAWVDPCVHALAVLTQLGWLVDADPFVLLALRGLDREDLLAALAAGAHAGDDLEVALDLGEDAAVRAAAALAALEDGRELGDLL